MNMNIPILRFTGYSSNIVNSVRADITCALKVKIKIRKRDRQKLLELKFEARK